MNNYAYVTPLLTNDYFKYLPHFIFNHKMHNCKYPIHVILTDRINQEIINYLQDNDILYTIFPEVTFSKTNNRYSLTRNKFYAWKLPYDKVLLLYINSYFLNLDQVLEEADPPVFQIQFRNNFNNDNTKKGEYLTIDGKTYIIRPNEEEFNALMSIDSTNEESVLNQLFLKNCLDKIQLSQNGHVLYFKEFNQYTTGVTKLLKEFKGTPVWD